MKVLVDTNVVMDALTEREPFAEKSKEVIKIISDHRADGFLAAHSVTNLFYLLRHDFSVDERKEVLLSLFDVFDVEPIDTDRLKSALRRNDFADFEDCLQSECAESVFADYIVTRNTKDFVVGPIQCLTPVEFCELFQNEEANGRHR